MNKGIYFKTFLLLSIFGIFLSGCSFFPDESPGDGTTAVFSTGIQEDTTAGSSPFTYVTRLPQVSRENGDHSRRVTVDVTFFKSTYNGQTMWNSKIAVNCYYYNWLFGWRQSSLSSTNIHFREGKVFASYKNGTIICPCYRADHDASEKNQYLNQTWFPYKLYPLPDQQYTVWQPDGIARLHCKIFTRSLGEGNPIIIDYNPNNLGDLEEGWFYDTKLEKIVEPRPPVIIG